MILQNIKKCWGRKKGAGSSDQASGDNRVVDRWNCGVAVGILQA
jgi:hypothetical protein